MSTSNSDSDLCPLLQEENNLDCPDVRISNAESSAKWNSVTSNKHDINKNVLQSSKRSSIWQDHFHPKAHWRSPARLKQFALLLAIAFIILYTNFVLSGSSDLRIDVIHYSHVPGMKDNVTEAKFQTLDETQSIDTNQTQLNPFTFSLTNSSLTDNSDLNDLNVNFASALSTFNVSNIINNTDIYPDNNFTSNSSKITTEMSDLLIKTTLPSTTMLPLNLTLPPKDYLVWSENCKIPNIDPYEPEVMNFFKREKYKPCMSKKALTKVTFNETSQLYTLSIVDEAIHEYSKSGVLSCCYITIERYPNGEKADSKVLLSKCIAFNKSTSLASTIDNIMVRCNAKKDQVYINGHAIIQMRDDIRKRLKSWRKKQKDSERPPSVLLLGIDSISRTNLIRAMPKTAQYLYDNEWFEMSGFNKMGDNTYPNLMALLTGLNQTVSCSQCQPSKVGGLETCSFIWKTYRDHGYVTAYAEDEASLNTFNYLKKGFEKPPTDFYIRPFLLAAEKHLLTQKKHALTYCIGYKHSAEFIYDYAVDFTIRYKDDPFFGFFWANTFSHNAISSSTAMDEKMASYLKKFSDIGTFNKTVVIFFSDHGLRFGPTLVTNAGHYEERLPFVFLWLPPYMKQAHPEFVDALSVNKNRLTNPYDLHMTLKHLLDLSGRVEDRSLLQTPQGCSKCMSLLKPVPHNRSCHEIAIEDHWCTCMPYQSVYKDSYIVKRLAQDAVIYINDLIATMHNKSLTKLCAKLQFDQTIHAYRSTPSNKEPNIQNYRVVFKTKPNKALYEVTLVYNENTKESQVTGQISRLNSYFGESECIKDSGRKKYCYCIKKPKP